MGNPHDHQVYGVRSDEAPAHNMFMRPETERLILDTWQMDDWRAFRPIARDAEVMRYISGGEPWTDEQIQTFVSRQIQFYSERGICRWRLLTKPAAEMIGFCGVGLWHDASRSDGGWHAGTGVAPGN